VSSPSIVQRRGVCPKLPCLFRLEVAGISSRMRVGRMRAVSNGLGARIGIVDACHKVNSMLFMAKAELG